jgi:hypothetical protein
MLPQFCGAALNRHYAEANLTRLALFITRQKYLSARFRNPSRIDRSVKAGFVETLSGAAR